MDPVATLLTFRLKPCLSLHRSFTRTIYCEIDLAMMFERLSVRLAVFRIGGFLN